ncbi:hypothetical protein MASR2M78_05620 [Treponema sp.]
MQASRGGHGASGQGKGRERLISLLENPRAEEGGFPLHGAVFHSRPGHGGFRVQKFFYFVGIGCIGTPPRSYGKDKSTQLPPKPDGEGCTFSKARFNKGLGGRGEPSWPSRRLR